MRRRRNIRPRKPEPRCPDCDYYFMDTWRSGVCDECGGGGRNDKDEGCCNCEGTGHPICCRCEGSGLDPEPDSQNNVRRNTLDEDRRRLERDAAAGDEDAARKLARLESRAGLDVADIDALAELPDEKAARDGLVTLALSRDERRARRVWERLDELEWHADEEPTGAERVQAGYDLMRYARRYKDQVYSAYDEWDREREEHVPNMDPSWSDLNRITPPLTAQPERDNWIVPNLMSGSDYGGHGAVTRSNHNVIMEQFGDLDGVVELGGGYGGYGVAIRLDVDSPGIVEALNRLENYPVLDDDAHSELERQEEEESWSSYVRSDFEHGLEHKHGCEFDNVSPDDLLTLFYELAESANEYWEHSSEGASIDVEAIVKASTWEDVEALGCVSEDKTKRDRLRRKAANEAIENYRFPANVYYNFARETWDVKGDVWTKHRRTWNDPAMLFRVTFKPRSTKIKSATWGPATS